MMKEYSNFNNFRENWIKNFTDCLINKLGYLDGSIKVMKKMVYRNGSEIPSFKINVALLVDTGKCFKESCSFQIYTDANTDLMYYTELYVWKTKIFSQNDVSKIIDYIIASIKEKEINYEKLAMTK